MRLLPRGRLPGQLVLEALVPSGLPRGLPPGLFRPEVANHLLVVRRLQSTIQEGLLVPVACAADERLCRGRRCCWGLGAKCVPGWADWPRRGLLRMCARSICWCRVTGIHMRHVARRGSGWWRGKLTLLGSCKTLFTSPNLASWHVTEDLMCWSHD